MTAAAPRRRRSRVPGIHQLTTTTLRPAPVVHFRSPAAFRRWLERHHASEKELWVGFWRKDSGAGGLAYPEALDEALCFGWIDGVRHKVDARSYTSRFTPRRARSNWSEVNRRRMAELIRQGRAAPAGRAAWAARDRAPRRRASYEQAAVALAPALLRRFRAAPLAWAFFSAQPPSYRRTAVWWVVSAKQAATRIRRFDILRADSAAGRRIAPLTPRAKRAR